MDVRRGMRPAEVRPAAGRDLFLENAAAIDELVFQLFRAAPQTPEREDFEERFEQYPYFAAMNTLRGAAVSLLHSDDVLAQQTFNLVRLRLSHAPRCRNCPPSNRPLRMNWRTSHRRDAFRAQSSADI